MRGLQRGTPAFTLALQVPGLREARAIDPHNLVADFEASVLDRAGHAVIGAGVGEREQVPARLEHSQRRLPHHDVERDAGTVPSPAHEIQLVRRISDDAVDRALGQAGQRVPTVAQVQRGWPDLFDVGHAASASVLTTCAVKEFRSMSGT